MTKRQITAIIAAAAILLAGTGALVRTPTTSKAAQAVELVRS